MFSLQGKQIIDFSSIEGGSSKESILRKLPRNCEDDIEGVTATKMLHS